MADQRLPFNEERADLAEVQAVLEEILPELQLEPLGPAPQIVVTGLRGATEGEGEWWALRRWLDFWEIDYDDGHRYHLDPVETWRDVLVSLAPLAGLEAQTIANEADPVEYLRQRARAGGPHHG